MKFRKKVLATTVAASLVLGSISGLPLSTQGALNKLGIHTAIVQAADTGDLSRFDALFTELNKDSTARSKMAAIHAQINADLAVESGLFFADLVAPVLDKINVALTGESKTPLTSEEAINLFVIVARAAYPLDSVSGEDVNYWHTMINNPSLRGFINKIALLGGADSEDGKKADFDLADIIAYVDALEEALRKEIDPSKLIEKFTDEGGLRDALRATVNAAFDTAANKTKLGGIFKTIGITGDDLMKSLVNIGSHYDGDGAGIIAMGSAVVRTQLQYSETVENNGRTVKPALKFGNLGLHEVLADWIVWSASSSNHISYDKADKAFKLASSSDSSTATIEARFVHEDLDVLLYKGSLKMDYTGGYWGGGGGGGSGPAPSTPTPEYKLPENTAGIIDTARGILDQTKQQLQGATQDQREAILAQIRAQMEAAVAELVNVDVSAAVTIDGNNAKGTVDVAELEMRIQQIIEEITKLNEELRQLDRTAAPLKAEITLNFGNVEADNAELTVPKAVMEKLKTNGLTHVAIQVNGVAIAYGVNDYQAEVKVNINKQDDNIASRATSMRLASGVYEFNFSVDGKRITSFDSPIELRLPVSEIANLDEELLAAAKIVGDTIIIYGGNYNPESNTVDVSRNSLSIYTVIENRVEFRDITPVQSWAGRSIQVAAAKGIINGRGDGVFDPQEIVTRAEFAKMIVLAFGLEDATATHSFTDVNSSDWFQPYVAAAVKAGIVKGRSADRFEPNGTITRAEMATMAARAMVITGKAKYIMNVDEALRVFSDHADIHSSMKDAVALAAKLGIVIGENNQFNPNDVSTRAQAAVVIYRLLQQQ